MAMTLPKSCFPLVAIFSLALLIVAGVFPVAYGQLDPEFYNKSCPKVETIVRDGVLAAVSKDSRMAASLLRLHFHDCIVNGCDASLLLDDSAGEKNAFANKNSARGYEVIHTIKSELEGVCPHTVSCSDILTLAAKEDVVWAGGPDWIVALGRRDGVNSSQDDANKQIPSPFATLEENVLKFTAKGLKLKDVVVLSGAHTIGFSQCKNFKFRLYNFSGTGKADGTIDPNFLQDLQTTCPKATSSDTTLVPLDSSRSRRFDNKYYSNIADHKSILSTDQGLNGNPVAASMIHSYSQSPDLFSRDFVESIVKMGNIGVLTGEVGQIRHNCRSVNA